MAKRMHFEELLRKELAAGLSGETMLRFWKDGYSTSKHLQMFVDICNGLRAKNVGEIGVGRSSFVLYEWCLTNDANFTCCDRYDYRDLFEIAHMKPNYIKGDASVFYKKAKALDFLFLDYMSSTKISAKDCYRDFKKALKVMKTNGIIAIHDTLSDRYNVKEALELLKKKYGKKIEVLTLPYGWGLGLIRNKTKSKYGKIVVKDVKKKDKK